MNDNTVERFCQGHPENPTKVVLKEGRSQVMDHSHGNMNGKVSENRVLKEGRSQVKDHSHGNMNGKVSENKVLKEG